jgi:hypothetical protein
VLEYNSAQVKDNNVVGVETAVDKMPEDYAVTVTSSCKSLPGYYTFQKRTVKRDLSSKSKPTRLTPSKKSKGNRK